MKSKRVLYIADYCLTPYERIPNAAILCEGDSVLAVGGESAFAREPGLEIVDLEGYYAVPGFIDTHIHGAGGFDACNACESPEGLKKMRTTLASHGVTTFLPTIISAPLDKMLASITALATSSRLDDEGAEPIGIHLEGPFINKDAHGSQKKGDILKIDMGIAKDLIDAGKGKVRIMTFAPELENATELVELLRENQVIPSMGHSAAGELEVKRAVDAGALRCTHLFNGMPQLHQRSVSLTTMALTDDRITIELILDNSLIDPRMVELACRAKPNDKVIGVSDANEGAGLSDGVYHLGDSEINVRNGLSTTNDGVLAGTTLTLELGWHHLVTHTHLDRTEAAACLTINPARSLGLTDRGQIRPGKKADISFFSSADNTVRLTVRNGRVMYDTSKST